MSTLSAGTKAILVMAIVLVSAAVVVQRRAAAQTTDANRPPLVISSLYGKDLYDFYCSSCHGPEGRGNGPTASALITAPADLTLIASRNGGVFPSARVESFVTGNRDGNVPAHGSKEMPVWGPIFTALDPHDEAMNRVRIANVVAYVESLQRRQ